MSSPTITNLALRFECIAVARPDALALVCGDVDLSFAALNGLANRLARWLAGRGVGRGDVVCLELPKRVEAYALALACLKIGAPYAFLDPAAPPARTSLMIGRCRPVLIVGGRDGDGPRVTVADGSEWLAREVEGLDDTDLPGTALLTGTDPAYVMFTSGSTGEPKGVVIPHQGVLHLVDWAARHLGIGPDDRLSNVNPLFFDNSVFDIYAGLLNGAAIVALDALKGRPPAELVAEIARAGCTFVFAVPTLFMFLDSMGLLTQERMPSVTRFMFGGEGFPVARLRRFHGRFAGRAQLVNCYGPTETSCICSGLALTDEILATSEGLPPLGRLNPGFSHRILDEDFRPVAAGGTGELWLGGPCVGLGYINNPGESAKRFLQDPLVEGYRAWLYRTGDLVCQDPETGWLHFRGRADNQVKLRGYRVELEEIDHALTLHEGVSRALAAVIHDATGSARLVAAYAGCPVEEADLAAHCAGRLPAYMVPGRFVRLDDLPTNANGKADRRAVADLLARPVAKVNVG